MACRHGEKKNGISQMLSHVHTPSIISLPVYEANCSRFFFSNNATHERHFSFSGIKRFLGCNHIRSYEYFIESINTVCPFLSVPCTSWEKFQNGSCFDCVEQHCPRFGFNAQPGNHHASVYLMTGRDKPFCSESNFYKLNSPTCIRL